MEMTKEELNAEIIGLKAKLFDVQSSVDKTENDLNDFKKALAALCENLQLESKETLENAEIETSVVDEIPQVVEEPVIEEVPSEVIPTEETPVVEETPQVVEAPVVEEVPSEVIPTEETPVVEETPQVVEAPAVEEVPSEVIPVAETPVVEETPQAVEETPVAAAPEVKLDETPVTELPQVETPTENVSVEKKEFDNETPIDVQGKGKVLVTTAQEDKLIESKENQEEEVKQVLDEQAVQQEVSQEVVQIPVQEEPAKELTEDQIGAMFEEAKQANENGDSEKAAAIIEQANVLMKQNTNQAV